MTLYIPTGATTVNVSLNIPNASGTNLFVIQSQALKEYWYWEMTIVETNDRYTEFQLNIIPEERVNHFNGIYNFSVQRDQQIIYEGLVKYITEEGGSNGTVSFVSTPEDENREGTVYYRPQY